MTQKTEQWLIADASEQGAPHKERELMDVSKLGVRAKETSNQHSTDVWEVWSFAIHAKDHKIRSYDNQVARVRTPIVPIA